MSDRLMPQYIMEDEFVPSARPAARRTAPMRPKPERTGERKPAKKDRPRRYQRGEIV